MIKPNTSIRKELDISSLSNNNSNIEFINNTSPQKQKVIQHALLDELFFLVLSFSKNIYTSIN